MSSTPYLSFLPLPPLPASTLPLLLHPHPLFTTEAPLVPVSQDIFDETSQPAVIFSVVAIGLSYGSLGDAVDPGSRCPSSGKCTPLAVWPWPGVTLSGLYKMTQGSKIALNWTPES